MGYIRVNRAMDPITVSITRTVKPGREAEFETALREFVGISLKTSGQLGVQIIRPAPESGSRQYNILRRFESMAARDAFYKSKLFRDWLDTVVELCEGDPQYEHLSGLETWFTLPGEQTIVPPPRWKMALVTLFAVYTTSVVMTLLLKPLTGTWPHALQVFLNIATVVVLLTWGVMPLLTRVLHRWLYPV